MGNRYKLFMCKVFGHRMYFNSSDISGESTCKRCGRVEPPIKWVRIPIPEFKPAKEEYHG